MFFILKAIIVEAQFEFLADRVNNFSKIIYISSPDRQKQYAYSASRTNGKCNGKMFGILYGRYFFHKLFDKVSAR